MASVFAKALLLYVLLTNGDGCRHIDHAIQCFNPVLQSSEYDIESNEVFAVGGNVEHVWSLCTKYYKAQGCMEESMRRCGGLRHLARDNLEIYVESVIKRGVVRLCDDPVIIESSTRYKDCFHRARNMTGACLIGGLKYLRFDQESVQGTSLEEMSNRHCVIVQDMMACGYRSLSGKCGHDAAILFIEVVKKFLPRRTVKQCLDNDRGERRGNGLYTHIAMEQTFSGADASRQLYMGIFSVIVGLVTVTFALTCMSSEEIDLDIFPN